MLLRAWEAATPSTLLAAAPEVHVIQPLGYYERQHICVAGSIFITVGTLLPSSPTMSVVGGDGATGYYSNGSPGSAGRVAFVCGSDASNSAARITANLAGGSSGGGAG